MQEEDAFQSLYDEINSDRSSSMKIEAFWIMANIDASWSKMPADEVPSRSAMSMLKRIKSKEYLYKDFVSSVYSKFIPARPADEGEGGASGGDGDYMDAMKAVERSFFGDGSGDNAAVDLDVEPEVEEEAPDIEAYDNVDDDEQA